MPKRAKERTAFQLRQLKNRGLFAVGGVAGLYLQVRGENARSWILRTKVGARRPDIGLGGYPDVSLEQARQRARDIRSQIWQGIDPLAARQAALDALKLADARRLTFDEAALACWKSRSQEFKNAKHAAQWQKSLTTYVSSKIGSLPVGALELPHIVSVLEPIWATKTETASRVRSRIEAVLEWAKTSGYRTGDNPARWDALKHVLPRPSRIRQVKHHAALPWAEIPVFMAALAKREGNAARALEFTILTAARSGEVRLATWDEINFEAKVWTVPAGRMKGNKTHCVPLSELAVTLLEALPRSNSSYVFFAPRGGALSDMALSQVCRRMGINAVPHGFRSTFKDWARSSTSYADEVSELALAHVSSDETRAAYARDALLPKRARLMRDWARYCAMPSAKVATVTMLRTHA